jgi:hypothetical protein
MRRRRALACLAGGLSGIAGCSGFGGSGSGPPDGGTSPTATLHRPGEAVEVPETGTFVLQDVEIQEAVFDFETGTPGLFREPDSQFLVFRLALEGEGYPPTPTVRLDGAAVPDDRVRRLRDGRFAARVPVAGVDGVTVELNGVRWGLPAGTVADLARRPRFRLRDVGVVTRGNGAAIEATVANEGDREGVWRAVAVPRTADDGGEAVRLHAPVAGERTGTVARFDRPAAAVTVTSEVTPDARGIAYRVDGGTATPGP